MGSTWGILSEYLGNTSCCEGCDWVNNMIFLQFPWGIRDGDTWRILGEYLSFH